MNADTSAPARMRRSARLLLSGPALRIRYEWGALLLAVLAAAVIGRLASPAIALPVSVALLVVIVAATKRAEYFAFAAIILAFGVFPKGVPFFVYASGVQFYVYEPFLILAFVWSLTFGARIKLPLLVSGTGIAVGGAWSVWGLAQGHQFSFINGDVRPLVDLCLTIPVAAAVVAAGKVRATWRVTVIVLWGSAVMTAASSVTDLPLAGREETATLDFASATSDEATRFLTNSSDLAIVVLSAVLTAALVYRVRAAWVLAGIPAFVIVFFGFSRNSLLGLAAALVIALVWALSKGRIRESSLRLSVVLVIVMALFAVAQAAPGLLASAGWLKVQLDAVSQRVFGGISASALSSDPSATYRSLEITYLVPAVADSPVLGHGFGYAYKPPLGSGLGFFAVQGRYYAHQYYLWLLVKVGVFGSALLFTPWVAAVVHAARANGPIPLALTSGLAAALVVSAVAPMPNGEPGALVVGAVLGALSGWSPTSVADETLLPAHRR